MENNTIEKKTDEQYVNNHSLKCFFGMHVYDIHKSEDLFGDHNVVIGTLYTLRCIHCGKLTTKKVFKYNAYR